MSGDFLQRLAAIKMRIADAASRSGRGAADIKLVAVTKLQPLSEVQSYLDILAESGEKALLGENYVQEFNKKREALSGSFEAHLIGPLQRNKAKQAVALFKVIQSVHSVEIARCIDTEAKKISTVQEVLLQVNVSSDPAKSGFGLEAVKDFMMNSTATLENLRIKGFMCIPAQYLSIAMLRKDYQKLYRLAAELKEQAPFSNLESFELSMGMSDDFEVAIEEGATMVRIGTALFGPRESK